MRVSRWRVVVVGCCVAIVASCGPPGAEVPGPVVEPVTKVVEPVIEPVVKPEVAQPVEPVAPIDLATVAAVRAKIVAIPNRKSWVPCGYIFSVGALEVEVLDVGEPPPRMVLLVQCPVPMHGRTLEVGAVVAVKLHARKQRWPSVGGLAKELVQRQVAEFEPELGETPR